jgi:hypothetical protein
MEADMFDEFLKYPGRIIVVFIVVLLGIWWIINSAHAMDSAQIEAVVRECQTTHVCNCPRAKVNELRYEQVCGADYMTRLSPVSVLHCQDETNHMNSTIEKYNQIFFNCQSNRHSDGNTYRGAQPMAKSLDQQAKESMQEEKRFRQSVQDEAARERAEEEEARRRQQEAEDAAREEARQARQAPRQESPDECVARKVAEAGYTLGQGYYDCLGHNRGWGSCRPFEAACGE